MMIHEIGTSIGQNHPLYGIPNYLMPLHLLAQSFKFCEVVIERCIDIARDLRATTLNVASCTASAASQGNDTGIKTVQYSLAATTK